MTVRLVAVFGAAAALLGVGAAPAAAHPTLLATSPEAGYAVTAPPRQVVLVFDEPVRPHAVLVLGEDRQPVRSGPVRLEQGGRRVVVALNESLAAGRYLVRWRVTAQDGDVVESAFDFAVGSGPAGLRGRQAERTAGLPVVVLLRWVLFAGLVVAVGGLVGERLARRAGVSGAPPSRVRDAALAGGIAAGGLLWQLLATGGGGRAVVLLVAELAGFAAAGLAARGGVAAAGLGLVVAAEAWRNHLGTRDGVPGAAVVAVHLAAVAVWVGALVYMLRTASALGRRDPAVRALVVAYARLALWLVVLVVGTGTIAALLLVPSPSALVESGYGRTLLVKLALVVAVVALALVGRWRLRRASRSPLGRAARTEAATLAGVLAVTAVLVSLPTPAPVTEDVGLPLPATGPVLRLGSLAGNVAVAVAASDSRLELRLRVPDDAVQLAEVPPPRYRISARVGGVGADQVTVPLRGCGPGCFAGPVSWRAGLNQLDLRVQARGWHGGTARLAVPWPPRVDARILGRVVAAMRAQRSLTFVETVTSDTSLPPPPAHTVTVTGADFVGGEPYADTAEIEVVRLPDIGGRAVIAFGLPAEGVQVRLELDDRRRIVRETLAAPKHLVERAFSYPDR